ncbi:phage tail sheath protein [Xylanibacillus composti]|uniref:Phage tail sheath protein n=1 Tax=Xylanibacillus composti TaxID=1572762 RepID=A0A8J4M3J5_9BACL|nr:phage tail sheath subtilisin-like domain-containing protein [Xylanibacillus composti]MDT9725094.1 phage tail sheath protein [Xylanibacillus composti]GIQ70909.1 hypothetical protein XYCOK13_37330 [Xylanibacillus composti]
MSGTWNPTALPKRPGLYMNFVEAATAQIQGGEQGTVAIPLLAYADTAEPKKVYKVSTERQASEQFGAESIRSIQLALQGGAKEVLVYTMPEEASEADYADMQAVLDTHNFHVFVFDGEFNAARQTAVQAWVAANREEGKHFMAVLGGDAAADAEPENGNARSAALDDDYIVNVVNGVVWNGQIYNSSEIAPFIAGRIAGTPMNRSITYSGVPADDVQPRLTNAQTKAALEAGSLVLTDDGEKVKIEQGVTTSGRKIRSVRARQSIATAITKTAADAYIGKIDNHADGQAALIAAVKAYLETLETANVLTAPAVGLDPQFPSVGDAVYLAISYTEVDSMERIFLTVSL